MKPKFISISAMQDVNGMDCLYALDEEGNVWYNGISNIWKKLDLKFDTGLEPEEKVEK